jgi:uncharacterized membrane-anchored protein YitT (DUF2179 family)
MNEYLYPLIASIITAIVTTFLNRRKYRAEISTIEKSNKGIEYENQEKLLEIYKMELDAMEKRIDQYIIEFQQEQERSTAIRRRLEDKIERLYIENKSLKRELKAFQK